VSEIASKASRRLQKFADKYGVAERADKFVDSVEQRATHAYGAVKERVQERPTMALGVAAGVGILIGLMLARRN
jgi:ElaB/YqjD/DUF883 family membrane-anchored ribosome-binding protein